MSPISSPLPDPGDPVGPAEAKVNTFLGEVRDRLNADLSVVASPPGSPTDGQICHMMLNESAGSIGGFRFRSASASPYKWEWIGGSPARLDHVGPFHVWGGGMVSLGGSWTCPWDGAYCFSVSLGSVEVASTSDTVMEFGMYLTPASWAGIPLGRERVEGSSSPFAEAMPGITWVHTLSAGDVVHVGAWATSNGVHVRNVSASIRPVRIAG